jgi:hypothetical protein
MSIHALAAPPELSRSAAETREEFVLRGRRLRAGISLTSTSRFSDDRWELGPAILQQHATALALDFARVPTCYRPLAKQLFGRLLSGPHPPGIPELSIRSVRQKFTALTVFWRWLDERATAHTARQARPAPALASLTGRDLEDYHRHLLATTRTRGPRVACRSAVRLLWFYRHHLADHLEFDPCHLEDWGEPHHAARGENRTDRIPEAVIGPLLAWALRFVNDFAADILTAVAEATPLHAAEHHTVKQLDRAAVQALLARHEAEDRPLPGFGGRVNITFLARKLGCHRASLRRHADRIAATVSVVGIAPDTYLDTQPTAHLDGQPWLEHFAYSTKGYDSIGTLARMLQTACYIVIAYLSGMRDGEIKHLQRGCLNIYRDTDGVPYRWKITSLAFKGEDDPAGVRATWSVGRPVADAVAALEHLQPGEQPLLFARLAFREGVRPSASNPVMSTAATRSALADFVGWINAYCTSRGRRDVVPDIGGAPWRFTTRQFRRTLAWHIARRPGGAIAGALHYRHQAIQLFEGYAGTSDSGFRAEVESEQALARGEDLLALIDEHDHERLTGPAADEAQRRLNDLAEHRRMTGQIVTDPRRLQRLMKRHDPAIYPGKYVTCIFSHAKALCSTGDHPDLGNCKPLRCRNVALTPANRAALTDELAAIDADLAATPPLPPFLRHKLCERRDAIAAFLDDTRLEQS